MLKKLVAALCILLPSNITCLLYRLCGYRIGYNTKLPPLSYVYAAKMRLGNDVDIRPFVYINVGELKIGSNTIISNGVQVKGEKAFAAGDNCFFGPHSLVHCEENVTFGFYSGIGPRTTIYTHGSFLPTTLGYPAKFAPVTVEDFVWIAMNVSLLAGTHIESHCIINPCVIVGSKVKSYTMLQLSAQSFQSLDLEKLLRFSKKDPQDLLEKMITGFCESGNISHELDTAKRECRLVTGQTLKYDPETYCFDLLSSSGKNTNFNLKKFEVDYHESDLVENLLFYLRRKWGLTLRRKY
ncbi:MAG: hypothetical protein GF398_04125 [Chitinivibrionales bacterium]|nr:hypothetical protein [Chitinivibrionales bacterium]